MRFVHWLSPIVVNQNSKQVAFQSDVVDVLLLSNMYQLGRLVALCEKAIVDEVDSDNAVALYGIVIYL